MSSKRSLDTSIYHTPASSSSSQSLFNPSAESPVLVSCSYFIVCQKSVNETTGASRRSWAWASGSSRPLPRTAWWLLRCPLLHCVFLFICRMLLLVDTRLFQSSSSTTRARAWSWSGPTSSTGTGTITTKSSSACALLCSSTTTTRSRSILATWAPRGTTWPSRRSTGRTAAALLTQEERPNFVEGFLGMCVIVKGLNLFCKLNAMHLGDLCTK